jgi:hypothetical protein
MQGGVKNYLGEQPMVNAPKYWQSAPDHEMTELAYITPQERDALVDMDMYGTMSGGPNEGPSGLMSLNGWGSTDKSQNVSGTAASAAETGSRNAADRAEVRSQFTGSGPALPPGVTPQTALDFRSAAINAGAGQVVNRGWFGPKYNQTVDPSEIVAAKAYRNDPNNLYAKGAYRATRGSNFGIGNLFRGALGMFGGWPGKAMSMLSRIDPRKLRGKNPDDSWRTQEEWQAARDSRINQSNIDRILKRKAPITEAMQERLASLGYTGEMPGVGSTGTSRAIDKDYTMEDTLREYPISTNRLTEIQNSGVLDQAPPYDDSNFPGIENRAMQKYLEDETNFNNQGIASIDTEIGSPWGDLTDPFGNIPGDWKGSERDDDPSDMDIFNKRFVNIKDMSVFQIKDFNALDRRDKMEKSGIEIPDPLNDEEKQRLEKLRNLRNSQAITEQKSYTV